MQNKTQHLELVIEQEKLEKETEMVQRFWMPKASPPTAFQTDIYIHRQRDVEHIFTAVPL